MFFYLKKTREMFTSMMRTLPIWQQIARNYCQVPRAQTTKKWWIKITLDPCKTTEQDFLIKISEGLTLTPK